MASDMDGVRARCQPSVAIDDRGGGRGTADARAQKKPRPGALLFCLESPLVCVAGITGSDLKKRIEHIMIGDSHAALGLWKKTLLGLVVAGVIAAPVAVGALSAPRLSRRTSESVWSNYRRRTRRRYSPNVRRRQPPPPPRSRRSTSRQ